MTELKLKDGSVVLVDDEDVPFLSKFDWKLGKNGYAYTTLYMHRLVCKTPTGLFTDHIDRNRVNNQKSNLRSVTAQENNANRSISKIKLNKVGGQTTSKHVGVCCVGNRWRAFVYINRRQKHLGYYASEALAHAAVCGAPR